MMEADERPMIEPSDAELASLPACTKQYIDDLEGKLETYAMIYGQYGADADLANIIDRQAKEIKAKDEAIVAYQEANKEAASLIGAKNESNRSQKSEANVS
jgi:hypothetical protein